MGARTEHIFHDNTEWENISFRFSITSIFIIVATLTIFTFFFNFFPPFSEFISIWNTETLQYLKSHSSLSHGTRKGEKKRNSWRLGKLWKWWKSIFCELLYGNVGCCQRRWAMTMTTKADWVSKFPHKMTKIVMQIFAFIMYKLKTLRSTLPVSSLFDSSSYFSPQMIFLLWN